MALGQKLCSRYLKPNDILQALQISCQIQSNIIFNSSSIALSNFYIIYSYKLWPITTEQSGELEISLQFRMPKVLPTQEHHSGIVGRFSSCKCNTWNKPGPTKNWAKPFHSNETRGTKTCPWRKFNGHSSCNISSNSAMLIWKGNLSLCCIQNT